MPLSYCGQTKMTSDVKKWNAVNSLADKKFKYIKLSSPQNQKFHFQYNITYPIIYKNISTTGLLLLAYFHFIIASGEKPFSLNA